MIKNLLKIYNLSSNFYSIAKKDKEVSYSQMLRDLRKNDKDKLISFEKSFKDAFDKAFIDGEDEPAKLALIKALESVDIEDDKKDADDAMDSTSQERNDFANNQLSSSVVPSFCAFDSPKDNEILPANEDLREVIPNEPKNLPNTGVYDNSAGIHGAGPSESSALLQI
jgi:hypothetical protein